MILRAVTIGLVGCAAATPPPAPPANTPAAAETCEVLRSPVAQFERVAITYVDLTKDRPDADKQAGATVAAEAVVALCTSEHWTSAQIDCQRQLVDCAATPKEPGCVATQHADCGMPGEDDRLRAALQAGIERASGRPVNDPQRDARQAVVTVEAALQQLDLVARELQGLDQPIAEAVDALAAAQTATERDAAQTRLTELERSKAEARTRLETAKADLARAKRAQGTHVSRECQDNPLARGWQ